MVNWKLGAIVIALLLSCDALAQSALTAKEKERRYADIRAERARLEKEIAVKQKALAELPRIEATDVEAGAHDLRSRYLLALVTRVRSAWVRPDELPKGQCAVEIRQRVGGIVEFVQVMPSCPYDEATRRSVEAAVIKAQPLPYTGFEAVFQPEMMLGFRSE